MGRLAERYSGMAWLERLGSDDPAGTRVVPPQGIDTVPSILMTLHTNHMLDVELSIEGVLWRVRCVPRGDSLRKMGYKVAASYLAADILDALTAAVMDFDEIASGAYLGVFGIRPVDREVR